jgi:glyoxylase-like metal-dependent hydrolase (beta-lactamase superfamily II)
MYKVDRVLADGEETTVSNLRLRTMYTSGHSIDSICFVSEIGGRSVLFSGDTFIGRQTRPDRRNHTYACTLGWLDGHWSDGLTTYVKSLRKLQRLNIDITLPGHGVPQDKKTTRAALEAGIASLKRVLDDEDLFVMFSVSR